MEKLYICSGKKKHNLTIECIAGFPNSSFHPSSQISLGKHTLLLIAKFSRWVSAGAVCKVWPSKTGSGEPWYEVINSNTAWRNMMRFLKVTGYLAWLEEHHFGCQIKANQAQQLNWFSQYWTWCGIDDPNKVLKWLSSTTIWLYCIVWWRIEKTKAGTLWQI